jgi:uncharacterized protein YjbJ (UPF0337 family)
MNWDRIEGNWKQLKGKIKEQWGDLTDDDLDRIAGRRDQLAGKLQETYGIGKDEAERQIDDWADSYRRRPACRKRPCAASAPGVHDRSRHPGDGDAGGWHLATNATGRLPGRWRSGARTQTRNRAGRPGRPAFFAGA